MWLLLQRDLLVWARVFRQENHAVLEGRERNVMLASSSHVRLVPQWKITETLAGRDLWRSSHMLSAGLSPMGRLDLSSWASKTAEMVPTSFWTEKWRKKFAHKSSWSQVMSCSSHQPFLCAELRRHWQLKLIICLFCLIFTDMQIHIMLLKSCIISTQPHLFPGWFIHSSKRHCQ